MPYLANHYDRPMWILHDTAKLLNKTRMRIDRSDFAVGEARQWLCLTGWQGITSSWCSIVTLGLGVTAVEL